MQTSLMFLDLTGQGALPNIQKIAIKMPDGKLDTEANEYSQFAEVISALMAITPEKLEASLDRMDWVKVEGGLSEYAPVIDFSEGSENGNAVWRELLRQIESDIHLQNNPISILNGANTGWDNQTIEKIKAAIEFVRKEGLPKAEMGTIENGKWAQPVSDNIDLELNPKAVGQETTKNANGLDVDFNGLGKEGDESKLAAFVEERPQWLKGNQTRNEPKKADADIHSNHESSQPKTGTRPIKETSIEFLKQGQTEGMNLKAGDSLTPVKNESSDNGHQETAPAQSFNQQQQLAQNNQQEADAFTRQEAKGHIKFDMQSSNHQPEQLEAFADKAGDAEDAPLNGRHTQKDTLGPAVHRTPIGSDRGIEQVALKSEWTPPASETRSNVIRQIVQRMTLRTQGSQSTMSIKLKPEFLGNLHMQVSTDNQQVVVRMAAESIAVKEMIEQGLQYLKTELQHHGLQIDKFDVFVANDNGDKNHGQDTAAFQQAFQERRQGKFGHLDNDNASDASDQAVAVQQVTDASSEINFFA
ncbi:MAG: flagellar hook-length control protein FliK [Desulfobacteraceae bacterium]|jgi:flagellar hook-length control protein FliK